MFSAFSVCQKRAQPSPVLGTGGGRRGTGTLAWVPGGHKWGRGGKFLGEGSRLLPGDWRPQGLATLRGTGREEPGKGCAGVPSCPGLPFEYVSLLHVLRSLPSAVGEPQPNP